MRNLILVLALLAITSLKSQQLELKKVVKEIQVALSEAEREIDSKNLPDFKSATVQFEGVETREYGGSVKLFIFTFGKKKTRESSSKVTVKLKNNPDGAATSAEKASLGDKLKKMIVESAYSATATSDGSFKLVADELTVELKFTIEKSKEGSGELEISPVTISGNGKLKNKYVHTVTILYSNSSD
ncbi:trypco2 family protein [Allomuricauda sp. R78024]|uniref:trypco2 family protein n=1 Tax=Allomuricauda sp. R78024 TaxID=3093867 RepID=UPI0037C508C6